MFNFLKILESGSNRTVVIKKNIAGSFFVKGMSVLMTLLLVPYTINLIDQEKYGVWMTIFSIVSWFNMMDIGIGNGFRNKFTEAITTNNVNLAKHYVQTLYSSMAIIGMGFIFIYLVINPLLNWYLLLNLSKSFSENINLIVFLVFALFCFQLYTKNITTVLLALQKTTVSNTLYLYANFLSLILIFILEKLNFISLLSIAMAFMVSPIIVNIFFSVKYFKGELKYYQPEIFRLPQKKYLNDLIGLGLKFFFIQITTIVMFSASNIIISHLYNPAQVTPYNVAFRLFSSFLSFFAIIITPFWSAFTEANACRDFVWIKKSMKKLLLVWGGFSLFVLFLWIISPFLFELWVGKEVIIPRALSFQFAFYAVIISWSNLFVFYVNGVGKIRLQLLISIVQLICNIPLAIFLAERLDFGLSGVIMATNISLLISAVLIPIQYYKLVSEKAQGIWLK